MWRLLTLSTSLPRPHTSPLPRHEHPIPQEPARHRAGLLRHRKPPWKPSSRAPGPPCPTPPACTPRTWCASADPSIITDCLRQIIERKRDLDFPWFPARVACHDILGQTALVDLAGLRDAIAKEGGDPRQVNPVVPVQLIVDHSLAVECGGFDPDAFAEEPRHRGSPQRGPLPLHRAGPRRPSPTWT